MKHIFKVTCLRMDNNEMFYNKVWVIAKDRQDAIRKGSEIIVEIVEKANILEETLEARKLI